MDRRTSARPASTTTTPATKTVARSITRKRGRVTSSRNGKATKRASRMSRRKRQFPLVAILCRTANCLLPATAESLIKADQRSQHVPLRLREFLLGRQALAFGIEDLQIAADPTGIACARETALVAQRIRKNLLSATVLFGLAIADEGIGNVAEGTVDRPLIIEQQLLVLRLRCLVVS